MRRLLAAVPLLAVLVAAPGDRRENYPLYARVTDVIVTTPA